MFFYKKKELPPMIYSRGQEVEFKFEGAILRGIIDFTDFGGALEHDYHSYDIFRERDNTLYKHIPEADILGEFISYA